MLTNSIGLQRSNTAQLHCFHSRPHSTSCTKNRRNKFATLGTQKSSNVKAKQTESDQEGSDGRPLLHTLLCSSLGLYLIQELPAHADSFEFTPGYSQGSYIVSLGLFLVTLPGLWSLIKRAPKAKVRRKTFEVAGPAAQEGAISLDARARTIFQYFKRYNYSVKSTGDVICFEGTYAASNSQAAALTLYTLVSLASTALVLSIAAPFGGNWWYLLCLISPAAGAYYLKNAERQEEFKVKMVTSDDETTTDIIVEGDEEEIDRMRRELGLFEKGKVYVKGILEELNQA